MSKTKTDSIGSYEKPEDLVPWEDNPRVNAGAVDSVAASIRRFGFGSPIIVQKGTNFIIAGHTRLLAAKKLGLAQVPVRHMDLSDSEARAMNIADNKTGEISTWDDAKLAQVLAELADEDVSLDGLGFDEAEVADLLESFEVESVDAEEAEPPPASGGSWRIDNGDCLELVKAVPDGSVNLILTDLPYGTTANAWDSVIDFDEMWAAFKRVLAPGGAVVLSSQGPFTATLICSNLKWFKYKWVWEKSKSSNFLQVSHMPLRKHEDICVFYSEKPTYNPQKFQGDPYKKGKRAAAQSGSYGDVPSRDIDLVNEDGMRNPVDIVYFATPESEGKGAAKHPTQKPVELGRYMVRTYTNPGDTVLDFTTGSGTFVVAAVLEGRNGIGFEQSEEYAAIARRRCEEAEASFE